MRFGRSPKLNAPRVKVARTIKIRRSDPASRIKCRSCPRFKLARRSRHQLLSHRGDFAMNKRSPILLSITALAGVFALTALLVPSAAWAQGQKVLKFIPQADLR